MSIDLRGHGESAWVGSYRASDYAEDVGELIEALQLTPAVVGHSLGGVVASTLASRHPGLVTALFLEDPPLYQGDPDIRRADQIVAAFPELAEQVRRWQRCGATEDELVSEYGASPSAYPGETMLDVLGEDGLLARVRAYLACDPAAIDAGFGGELWEGYEPVVPISCPVTVLAADPSINSMFRPEHADRYRDSVPQADIVFVPGSAHTIHIERGGLETYIRSLAKLLDSI